MPGVDRFGGFSEPRSVSSHRLPRSIGHRTAKIARAVIADRPVGQSGERSLHQPAEGYWGNASVNRANEDL
jgi:hypothetical protein